MLEDYLRSIALPGLLTSLVGFAISVKAGIGNTGAIIGFVYSSVVIVMLRDFFYALE